MFCDGLMVRHFESKMADILTQNIESSILGTIEMQHKVWIPESVAMRDRSKCRWQIHRITLFQWLGCRPFWIPYGRHLITVLSLDLYNPVMCNSCKDKQQIWRNLIKHVYSWFGCQPYWIPRWLTFYLKS